jgi:hypothetical protein
MEGKIVVYVVYALYFSIVNNRDAIIFYGKFKTEIFCLIKYYFFNSDFKVLEKIRICYFKKTKKKTTRHFSVKNIK